MNAKEKLQLTFNGAKADITECWENPLRGTQDRIHHTWIYSVDPETMQFAKAVWNVVMNKNTSLYDTFCMIMKSESVDEMINKNKANR